MSDVGAFIDWNISKNGLNLDKAHGEKRKLAETLNQGFWFLLYRT
jgi:hypothetical protein